MTLWEVPTMTFTQSEDLTSDTAGAPFVIIINAMFIGKGGRKVYRIDDFGNDLQEFDLPTPWDITGITLNQDIDTSTFSPNMRSIWFTPDGLTFFDITFNAVRKFNVGTAWDISTINTTPVQSEVLSEDNNMQDLWFTDDGLQLFTVGMGTSSEGSPDRVYKYSMTTPYDLTTLTLVQSLHVTENNPSGLFLREDGLRMYVTGPNDISVVDGQAKIFQYNLTSPFNITSGSVSDTDIDTIEDIPMGIFFHPSGARMYHMGRQNAEIYQWRLGDIPMFTFDEEFDVSAKLIQDGRIVPESQPKVNAIIIPPPIPQDAEFFVGARIVLFCDTIEDNTGWIVTNGGGQILIDDISAPNVIRLEQLTGGAGTTERWVRKDIGKTISGDIKIEFKFDFIDNSTTFPNTSARMRFNLQENVSHPDVNPGDRIGFDITGTVDPTQILLGRVSDVLTTVAISNGGSKNQHTTHIYKNTGFAQSDVKGPYFVTIELKDGKVRTSLFKDKERTRHFRGSPIEVDSLGVNPNNLRFLTISNAKGAGAERQITAEIDEIYITQNETPSAIPDKVFPATGAFVEDWEGQSTGDQNPSPWFSQTDFTVGETPLIDIHEVSTENPETGIKDFKMHTQFTNATGAGAKSRTSIARAVDANPTEDGSGLDIPLALSMRLRADTLDGDPSDRSASVTVQYLTIAGAPAGSGTIQFRLFGNGDSEIFNGLQWVESDSRRLSESNTLGAYAGFAELDLKQIFDSDSFISDNLGLDFESHIDQMIVGFGARTISSNVSDNTENLIYGDNISLLNSNQKAKTFGVNLSLIASPIQEFTIRAELSTPNIEEFFVSAVIGSAKNREYKLSARLVIRQTVNNAIADAILVGTSEQFNVNALVKAFNQEEEFFIDALVAQFTQFTCVNAILVPTIQIEQETFEVNGLLQGSATRDMLVDAKIVKGATFLIDSIVLPRKTEPFLVDAITELTEPQMILEAESVIGHKTGLNT